MKELSIEEKAKSYDKAIEKAKDALNDGTISSNTIAYLQDIFPELKENGDEKIRQFLIHEIEETSDEIMSYRGMNKDSVIAWLERQGEQKPVNEDAEKEKSNYVSGQFLYCKGSFNEFKEGESYWLEYIGNDTYVGRSDNVLNQKFHITPRQLYTWLDPRHPEHPKEEAPMSYGKELESKLHDACARYYSNGGDTISLAGVFYAGVEAQKEIEQKPVDKVEPKFHEGDWTVSNLDKKTRQISEVHFDDYNSYYVVNGKSVNLEEYDRLHRLWTIQDAKDGDVLSYRDGQWCFIYKDMVTEDTFKYYALLSEKGITVNDAAFSLLTSCIAPATREQREKLYDEMHEAGYEWDAIKLELRKIDVMPAEWSREDEACLNYLIDITEKWCNGHDIKMIPTTALKYHDWLSFRLKSLISQQQGQEWSEEDEDTVREIKTRIAQCNGFNRKHREEVFCLLDSLRPQNTWKPSDDHYELEEFAKIVRGNLTGISKAVQKLFETKYLQITGNKMYGGFKD